MQLYEILTKLTELEHKVSSLTYNNYGNNNLSSIIYKLEQIKDAIANVGNQTQPSQPSQPITGLDDIINRIVTLENKIDNDTIYDDTQIQAEIASIKSQIQSLNTQGYDDTELSNRVTALENKVDNDTIYDDTAIVGRIEALENKVDNDTIYDDTDIKSRLDVLENKVDNDTIYDDTILKNRLELLESMIFNIDVEVPVRDDMGEEYDNNQSLVTFDYSFGNNTLTVSGPFANLFDYDSSDPVQGNGKWIGVGIKTGQELTNISVDGNMLTDQDKIEAKANGLSDDAFIFWFKAKVDYTRNLILRNKYFEKTITIKFKDVVSDV